MVARLTNVIDSIASFTPSARSAAVAARRTSARDTLRRRTLDEISIASPRGGLFIQSPRTLRSGARVLGVRLDDLANESVPHYVGIGQILKADAIDAGQDPLDLHKSRLLPPGKIDLRLVAGDDSFRVNSEARQKHLHLRGGRVLRLVENDERVSECSSPHVGQRGDLDGARVD